MQRDNGLQFGITLQG